MDALRTAHLHRVREADASWIKESSRVFVARHGRHELTNLFPTSAQVDELVERMLKSSERRST